MEIISPEGQFQVFLDDVRLPADALVGHPDQGIAQLFAGLNPERVMAAAYSLGVARLAMRKATEYARERKVWGTPIGAHQGLAHPLAACQIEIECARLMTQKAAWLIDAGQDAGTAANSAKYAAAEAAVHAVDQAIQTHGGNGLSQEYGVGRAAGDVPREPDRAGQPGDDPQLRRPARPAAAPLLLTPQGLSGKALPGAISPEMHGGRRCPARASTPVSSRPSRPRRRRSTRPCSPARPPAATIRP